MEIVVKNVSPTQAKKYLADNKRNRKVSDRVVRQYANDMREGKWKLTGDPVKFDTNNNLIDGQHRLHAIIIANKPQELVIATRLDPTAQDVIDTGRRRTAANMLQLRGHVQNTALVASTARVGITDDKGLLTTSRVRLADTTHSEVLEWVDGNYAKLWPIITQVQLFYRTLGGGRSASMLYAFHRLFQTNYNEAQKFIMDLTELNTQGRGDPKVTLLRRLDMIAETVRDREAPAHTIYSIYTAWNAVRRGEELTTIYDGPHGKPIPELEK